MASIYGFIRITVAAYLFMTGYGHTAFFYQKADYSFKRAAGVLVRLNLLSCVLPHIMKTEYSFYYFAPLVSFWFLVVYATMRIGAGRNKNTTFLLSKIAVSAMVVTAVVRVPGVLEAIFEVPHVLARTQWGVKEFRFRVFLDMWIVYVGMLASLAVIKAKEAGTTQSSSFSRMRTQAAVAAAVALPLFFVFQVTRESKFAYNAYHPYVSWIPIVSFIVLRNATAQLRNSHSRTFAWVGRCSLETFTLQYHVWMAADTRGLLDMNLLGMHGGVLNFAVATTVFLYTSHCVAEATGELTA